MWPWATTEELVEITIRTYADEEPGFVADAVYCYGQERGNMPSVVKAGARIWKSGKARVVAKQDLATIPEQYRGLGQFLHQTLLEEGVPPEAIVGIPHPEEFKIANTHTEAVGLARYAKAVGWATVYVTALPSHLLRAFTETITAVIREFPQLRAHSVVGSVLPWTEDTLHSQGIVSGKRFKVIGAGDKSEMSKILTYYLKGDLVSAREALDYLNAREMHDERRRPLIIGKNNEVIGLG